MERGTTVDFIAIDDDKGSNMITEYTIRNGVLNAEIHTFQDAEKGIAFIENSSPNDEKNYVILLDINMPQLSGWEVLDKISILDKDIQDRLKIFILSSSVNPGDKEMAENNRLVSGYFEKPFRKSSLQVILEDMDV